MSNPPPMTLKRAKERLQVHQNRWATISEAIRLVLMSDREDKELIIEGLILLGDGPDEFWSSGRWSQMSLRKIVKLGHQEALKLKVQKREIA